MKTFLFSILFVSTGALASQLPTAKNVDVSRYVGKWYAHYSLPQFFTRSCRAQTAEYEIINEKTISVLNTCIKQKDIETIKGKAVVVNPGDNSKLVVTFENFFTRLFRVKGDYNIIKLDPNYEVVLVGSNDRSSLWLMTRSELPVSPDVKEKYLRVAKELGFDVTKLKESRF